MTEIFNTETLNPSLKTVSQADLDQYAPRTVEDLNKSLPQYEFVELIAVGGMGAVYKARQTNLDRLVAIKLLPKIDNDEFGFGNRFAQEAKAMAKLSHPHIVPIFDFGETKEGQAYFAMEFVEGADMFQLICGGQLTLDHFFGWIPQVCSAIAYAHKRDIVHRDIKPANILIDKEGNVKMADFGLARLTGARPVRDPEENDGNDENFDSSDAISMGTPGYAAPEQFDGHGKVDARADIYALGVVMYQMLTGRMPIGAFPMPSECSPNIDIRLDEVVLRAMQEDATDRFQSVGEISARLSAIHATKNGVPEKKNKRQSAAKKETKIDSNITPSGKRLLTGRVQTRHKGAPLATGRVSTLAGKIAIPPNRVAAAGKVPALVTGRVATLSPSTSSARRSTQLRKKINQRKKSRPPYLVPAIIVALVLIIFMVLKSKRTSDTQNTASQDELMDDIASVVKSNDYKTPLNNNEFVFLHKISSFNQDAKVLAVMRRDGKKLQASGITQIPKKLKAIHTLKISATRKNSKPFALALHPDGTLSAWGDNTYGQLEIPKAAANVIQIAVGIDHALALTQDGKVIAWGGNTTKQCNIPKKMPPIKKIAAGSFHSLALSIKGKVIPWGKGTLNKSPTRLRGNDFTVSDISAAAFHSFALIDDGTLIGWGKNDADQLAQPEVNNAISIACSDRASYSLSKNGEVSGWGTGIQPHPSPKQTITHIEAFPDTLILKNTKDQWLFYGAKRKITDPISAPSSEMRYFISPQFVFAWPAASSLDRSTPIESPSVSQPRPNPNTEAGKLITEIDTESKKIYAEQIKQPLVTAIEKLNNFYVRALDSEKNKTGESSEAYQNEINSITNGQALQAPANSNLPDGLLSMRGTYLKKLNIYEQDLKSGQTSRLQKLDAKLKKVQQEFTQSQKNEAALEVKNFRQQLKQWLSAENK